MNLALARDLCLGGPARVMGKASATEAGAESVDQLIDRVARRLHKAGIVSNLAGIFDTYWAIGFVVTVVVGHSESSRIGWIDGPIVVLYALAVPFIGPRLDRWHLEPTRRWLAAGAPPGGGDVARALAIPRNCALASGLMWVVGMVLITIVNLIVSTPAAAFSIAFAGLLGAITTSALFYLRAERAARPLTIRALAAEPVEQPIAPGVRARLIAAWVLGTGVPLVALIFVGIVAWTKSGANPAYVGQAVIFLALLAAGTGLMALASAAGSIARPVAAVRRALERVEEGSLETRVDVDDGSEVGLMEAGFNRMAAGLEERERLRDLFGRHVGRDVAAAALDGTVSLGGEEREVGALFVDVTASTALASRVSPSDVVALLNRFFAVVVSVVEANGGLVNKFEGDAALCVFGAPVRCDDCAGDALRAARELAARLRSEVSELDFGIGVSAGRAVAGNVGAEERFEYTVIGDPVNEAARLCELAKARPERVLTSSHALEAAASDEAVRWLAGEKVTLRGRESGTELAAPAAAAPTPVGSIEADIDPR
jgi:adenylate cyclase